LIIVVDGYTLSIIPNPTFTVDSNVDNTVPNTILKVEDYGVITQISVTVQYHLTASPFTPGADVHTINGNTAKLKVYSVDSFKSLCTQGQSSVETGSTVTITVAGQTILTET